MSDQYLHPEGGSYFHLSDGGHIIHNEGAEIPGNSHSDGENESTYFTDLSNMLGQISSFGDDSTLPANDGGYFFDTSYDWFPNPQPEYHPNCSTDFSRSGLIPHPEDNPFFAGNSGDPSYDIGAAATHNFEQCDETRHSTDFRIPDQTPHFGDGSTFSGGAGELPSHASGAEILNNAVYNPRSPLYLDMMLQPTVVPQSGCNHQDAPQSGDDYEFGPPDPIQSNESPLHPQNKPGGTKWTEEDSEKLWMWFEDGMRYWQIGARLNRTVDSCKYRRLEIARKKEIEARIKAQEEADAAAQAPKNTPVLRIKDASHIDFATPGLKDKSLVDWNTPDLKDWVHDQLEAIREVENGGPWINAWNTVAKQLNDKNKTNLEGKDLIAKFPYR